MRKLISSLACVLTSVLAFAEPKTIYVDQNVKVPGDGTNWESAVKTIQEGVNKASKSEVDTVLVAPGEYADDLDDYGSDKFRYRVKLDRKVILKSSKGKEVTHIVGRRGDGAGGNNPSTGLPPVTCVYIPDEGLGSTVEGFTIRDGETSKAVNATACRSAGVGNPTKTGNNAYYLEEDPEKFWYVAYCTISNCCAARGSAMTGGTLIGSVISDNKAWHSFAAVTYVHAYDCLFARNATSTIGGGHAHVLVNCMVVNDETQQRGMSGVPSTQGGPSHFYNCAIFNEVSSVKAWNDPVCSYCLVDSDGETTYVDATSDHITPIPLTDKYTNLVMSVLTGDYRPVKDGRLDGKGCRDYLDPDFVPEAYVGRDFNGNALAAGAPVPIGLILPRAEPATVGFILPSVGMKINGHSISYANHAHYADVWPSVVRFSAADGYEDLFAGVAVGSFANENGYRKFCGKYDFVPLTLPPCEDAAGNRLADVSVSKVEAKAEHVLWVDDDAEFTGDPDGSTDRPYKTPQDAVDAAASVTDQPFHIINVRRGIYGPDDRTRTDGTGLKACIVVGDSANFIMRGVDGAAETFIEGAPDPAHAEDADNTGIGQNAVRCVYAPSSADVAFSGLTFRKGYGGGTDGTGRGGALHIAAGQKSQAYDCVFTDNHIHANATGLTLQGSCCYNGWAVRCRFTGNPRHNRGVICNTVASGCLFDLNSTGIKEESYGVQDARLYNCTFYEPGMKCTVIHTSAFAENCIIAAGGTVAASSAKWCQNIVWGLRTFNEYQDDQMLKVDPWLAAQERGDYRPIEESQAIGHAAFDRTFSDLGIRLRNVCTDFENESVFTADGKVTAGAFATAHEKANVYVDATNGNDEQDGHTEATAKKTLAAAVDVLCRKDRIVALPGVYKDGSMIHSVSSSGFNKTLTVRARVVVPDYSELVALGSVEDTIIEGAADPNPVGTDDEIAHGLGPNAIRGVVLGEGSVLRGFTVTKGHTRGYDDTEDFSDNVQGAGVLGRAIESSRVEDCIVKGNAGAAGGGGAFVSFVRCRILDNVGTKIGSALRYASIIDTFIDGSRGERVCERVRDAIGCTFGADNLRLDGTRGTMTVCNPSSKLSARIWNVLSYAPVVGANQVHNGDIRNCVFPKGAQFTEYSTLADVNTDYDADELKALYEAGVPKTLKAPSVDEGYANDLQGTTDATGVMPRICNAVIDIGCYEADWKPQYAKDLGGKRATVTAATSNVRDVGGAVVLGDGAMIALDLAPAGAPVKIAFAVTDGTLTVMRNGQSLGTYTTGQTLSISDVSDLESFAFSYTGTGSAALACCKAQPGMVLMVR